MRYDTVKNYLQIWSKGKIVLFLPANRSFPFTRKQCFSVWEINKYSGPQTQPRIKMYLVPHAKWHLQAIDFSGRLEVFGRDLSQCFSILLCLQKPWSIRCCSAGTLHVVQGNGGAGCPAILEAGQWGCALPVQPSCPWGSKWASQVKVSKLQWWQHRCWKKHD